MKPIVGFPPVFDSGSRILILGSMPGEASLAAGQYYAHPRNAFWPLIAGVLGVSMPVDYADRLAMLQASGVALWDVIARCKRQGSLDSAIVADTVCVNDFEGFFPDCPLVDHVFFNGTAAEAAFRRHVTPPAGRILNMIRLPSSSPAYASMTIREKHEAWMAIAKVLKR